MTRKQWIAASLLIICSFVSIVQVKTGIEVLRERNFDILQGKRVGLCTNPTGVDRNLVSTIDILWESKDVNLVALYGPEHGVRGDVHAGDHVTDIKDATTGLPVYSLYGKTRKATPEMLKDVDVWYTIFKTMVAVPLHTLALWDWLWKQLQKMVRN